MIIILAIAAVALIWGPIKNLIVGSTDDLQANCFEAEAEIISASCTKTTLKVIVQNNAPKAAEDVQILYGEGSSLTNEYFGTQDISFTGLNKNAQYEFEIDVDAGTNAVKVALIINGETCDATPVKSVSACT